MNGWKLLERLDDDKWLEISRKAGYCRMAGNEDNGWIFSNGWKLVQWLDFFGWLEIDSMAGYLLMAGDCQMAGNEFQFIGPKKSEICNKIIILLLLHALFLKIVV